MSRVSLSKELHIPSCSEVEVLAHTQEPLTGRWLLTGGKRPGAAIATALVNPEHGVRQGVHRIPPPQREEVRELLETMLKDDVIQPSSSPWASPIVLVRKKDGSIWFCVDYRKVNDITHKDAYAHQHYTRHSSWSQIVQYARPSQWLLASGDL